MFAARFRITAIAGDTLTLTFEEMLGGAATPVQPLEFDVVVNSIDGAPGNFVVDQMVFAQFDVTLNTFRPQRGVNAEVDKLLLPESNFGGVPAT